MVLYLCKDSMDHQTIYRCRYKKGWQQNISAANITNLNSLPSGIKDQYQYHHFPMLRDNPVAFAEVFLLLVINRFPSALQEV